MGVHTAAELMASGISRGAITYRTKSGELLRLLPRVYATSPPDYFELCRAVTLWKPSAVVSHSSAAWLWGLTDREPKIVDATVGPAGQARCPEWVRLHRRQLPATVTYRGLRIVTIEQAFVDMAATLQKAELEAFVDATLDVHLPWRRVAEVCEASSGMRGMTALREQLRRCCPGTRSEPERMVARALTARNFRMEINARVGPFYGDLVDFRARVIVEIDGREFHIGPAEFSNDRRRQNALVLEGWLVLRYSAATVRADLDRVVDEIISVVRKRRRSIDSTSRALPRS
ncbi:hypothetical protein CH267_11690 [Rhodococcus sp. 06-621-2]|nr:type IV toxin-antitoxin system AbiEi family antitoxin domain-containing protein [Rhodococcus sp. 06-621-2]OZC55261.1 hypothetical protein CH267_11690 [Rhodococcus sp. 06-621-2]